ncbi:MAG TPA: DUF2161 family putative PD-(D/E)XK-type phosphodiesterase [Acetivibrio sp.]|nr:DUF2161 family putative PD-(D/E)XK-type phosphodiesterase [Acetivibrio sp.]HPT90177.1 DUF2161 family putative PD-(D/E)XK-type phosphodiesterase [Acetivibrio sp.]HQA57271.1 DUF2161 family putative PD-(D/E)XK-type phosphodiesterase [Acetivibrio sp.]
MNDKKEIMEEDLYAPVKNYLTKLGYDVKGEVQNCDVTALKGETLLVVEMKKTLNLDVILQAALRQRVADIVYIAVPKKGRVLFTKRWRDICHLLRRLEIGLLLVSFRGDVSMVEEAVEPKPFSREKSRGRLNKKKSLVLKEFSERQGDYNTGGCTRKKLVTAYREKSIQIAALIKANGPLSIKQLKERGADRDKVSQILQNNFYDWFVRVSRGVYDLSERGKKEIENYSELLDYYTRLDNMKINIPKS